MHDMNKVDAIFVALGGTSKASRVMGVSQSAGSEMRRRKCIPVRYWPRVIEKVESMTADRLMHIHLAEIYARDALKGARK